MLCIWTYIIYKGLKLEIKSINEELKYLWSIHTLEHFATMNNYNIKLYLLIWNNEHNILMNEKWLHICFHPILVNMLAFGMLDKIFTKRVAIVLFHRTSHAIYIL